MPRPLFVLVLIAGTLALPACGDNAQSVSSSYDVPPQNGAHWPKFWRTPAQP